MLENVSKHLEMFFWNYSKLFPYWENALVKNGADIKLNKIYYVTQVLQFQLHLLSIVYQRLNRGFLVKHSLRYEVS